MKKILLAVSFIFFFQVAQSQVWIDVGVKVGYGMSLLYNSNIFDDVPYNHQFGGGLGFGGRVGLNFGKHHGFTMDVMSHSMKQKFEYKLDFTGDDFHTNLIEWKNLDLYLLYRGSSHKVYVEVGPMFSLVRKLKQTDSRITEAELVAATTATGISDFYRDNYVSGVIGFGGYLVGTETVSLNIGFRIHYAFQDFISDLGQDPDPSGAIKSFPAPIRDNTYDPYKKTSPLMGEVSLELNFGLGGTAKTNCSDRMHWFWSGNKGGKRR